MLFTASIVSKLNGFLFATLKDCSGGIKEALVQLNLFQMDS